MNTKRTTSGKKIKLNTFKFPYVHCDLLLVIHYYFSLLKKRLLLYNLFIIFCYCNKNLYLCFALDVFFSSFEMLFEAYEDGYTKSI